MEGERLLRPEDAPYQIRPSLAEGGRMYIVWHAPINAIAVPASDRLSEADAWDLLHTYRQDWYSRIIMNRASR